MKVFVVISQTDMHPSVDVFLTRELAEDFVSKNPNKEFLELREKFVEAVVKKGN